jgi:hypothetical protein
MQNINYALSFLQGQAFQWFEPRFSRRLGYGLAWLNNWDESVQELKINFGLYHQQNQKNLVTPYKAM